MPGWRSVKEIQILNPTTTRDQVVQISYHGFHIFQGFFWLIPPAVGRRPRPVFFNQPESWWFWVISGFSGKADLPYKKITHRSSVSESRCVAWFFIPQAGAESNQSGRQGL